MKIFFVLALAGLGAAAPAFITQAVSEGPVSTKGLRHPVGVPHCKFGNCHKFPGAEAIVDRATGAHPSNDPAEASPAADLDQR